LGVVLSIANGSPALVGSTGLTWTSATTQNDGTGGFASVVQGIALSGDTTILFGTGLEGSSAGSPFTITFGTLGTFVATVDVADLTRSTHAESFDISGYFTPAGALASSGFSETSADLFFSLSQSTISGHTSTTGTFTLSTPSDVVPPILPPPPPPPTVPEPSSLALLGTGILGGVGVLSRRPKARA